MKKIKTPWWIWILTFLTLGMAFLCWIEFKKNKEVRMYVDDLVNNGQTYSASNFKIMYNSVKKSNLKLKDIDQSGVYIICNLDNNKHYVGQSITVIRRVNAHLKGKGNGDVYADFKYGANLEISIIKCSKEELNMVEKQCIHKYNAFEHGYNKSKGIGRGW